METKSPLSLSHTMPVMRSNGVLFPIVRDARGRYLFIDENLRRRRYSLRASRRPKWMNEDDERVTATDDAADRKFMIRGCPRSSRLIRLIIVCQVLNGNFTLKRFILTQRSLLQSCTFAVSRSSAAAASSAGFGYPFSVTLNERSTRPAMCSCVHITCSCSR